MWLLPQDVAGVARRAPRHAAVPPALPRSAGCAARPHVSNLEDTSAYSDSVAISITCARRNFTFSQTGRPRRARVVIGVSRYPLEISERLTWGRDVRFRVVRRSAGTSEAGCVERALGQLHPQNHGSRQGDVRAVVNAGARAYSFVPSAQLPPYVGPKRTRVDLFGTTRSAYTRQSW